jgi:hypothetical protein
MEKYDFAQIFKVLSGKAAASGVLGNAAIQGDTAKLLLIALGAFVSATIIFAVAVTVIYAVKRKKLKKTFAERMEAAERTDREFDEILKTLEAKMLNTDEKKEENE